MKIYFWIFLIVTFLAGISAGYLFKHEPRVEKIPNSAVIRATITTAYGSYDGTLLELIKIVREEAYYDGQKEAINGDVRIKKVSDSQYVWIKSPWDSGEKPTFYPSIMDSLKSKKNEKGYW